MGGVRVVMRIDVKLFLRKLSHCGFPFYQELPESFWVIGLLRKLASHSDNGHWFWHRYGQPIAICVTSIDVSPIVIMSINISILSVC